MKILYINWGHNLNGSVNVSRVYEILKQFALKKAKVFHLTPQRAFAVKGVKNIVIRPTHVYKKNFFTPYILFLAGLVRYSDSPDQETWTDMVIEYINNNSSLLGKIDVVYINTSPYCLCRIGNVVKNKLGAKVVIDFQDPFYYSPYKNNLPLFDFWLKVKETEYLKACDLLIANTQSAYKAYSRAYPKLKVVCVTNMAPSLKLKPKKNLKNKPKKLISYGGSLFIGRDIFSLLKALSCLNEEKYEVEVIGDHTLINKIRYFRYWTKVIWKSKIAREKYYQHLLEDVDIGLVAQRFTNRDINVQCVAAKTYDYLALNKPIIYIGPAGDNAMVISKYSTNSCVVTNSHDFVSIKNYLNSFKEKKLNTKKAFFSDYTAQNLYSKMYDLIKSL